MVTKYIPSDANNGGFNNLKVNSLSTNSNNTGIEVLTNLNMNGNSIDNLSIDSPTLDGDVLINGNLTVTGTSSLPTVLSPSEVISVASTLKLSNSAYYFNAGNIAGGVLFPRVSVWDGTRGGQGSSSQYAGFYISSNVFGCQMPLNNNMLFTTTTTDPNTYLGTQINGNGGIVYYASNGGKPPNPSSGAFTIYSNSDFLECLDSSGNLSQLSTKYTAVYPASSSATTCSTAITYYNIQADTWVGINTRGFNNSLSGNNLITYAGSTICTCNMSVYLSMSSATNVHSSTFAIYKNPTFTGTLITGGTILIGSINYMTYDTIGASYNCTLNTIVAINPGDTFCVAISDSFAGAVNTANNCVISIMTI